jgi:hypothetical protein
MRRRVRADDPGSPPSSSVEVLAADDEDQDLEPAAAALSKSRRWVLAALGELEAAGLAQGSEEGNGRARYWSPATPDTVEDAGRGEDTAWPARQHPRSSVVDWF